MVWSVIDRVAAWSAMAVAVALCGTACGEDRSTTSSSFSSDVAPLFVSYCQPCHAGATPAGGLSLAGFDDETIARRDPELVEVLLERLQLGDMPPPSSPRPPAELIQAFSSWAGQLRFEVDCKANLQPGPAPLRRLSSRELANSLRQTLALPQSFDFSPWLARDDSVDGFTNTAETLSLDSEMVSGYLDAVIAGVDYALRAPATTSYETLLRCDAPADESACANEILQRFSSRAFRRPVEADEMEGVLAVYRAQRDAGSFEDALKAAFGVALLSPSFLMRLELDRDNPDVHELSQHELASRLSYFLWSAPPDDELRNAADDGQLATTAQIERQVERMLRSRKREALVDGFAAEWLALPALEQAEAVPEELKRSMVRETKAFMAEVLFSPERPMKSLLHADFTFVDPTLATHYGLTAPGTEELALVSTVGTVRTGGVLTQASFLTMTSTPTAASFVKRGAFTLGRFLCAAPPPPPPDAAASGAAVSSTASLREQLEQHRANPACAACHVSLDPIGFGLANFDRLGAYRAFEDEAEEHAIDASGQLPTGDAFRDADELSTLLSTHPSFVRCTSEKLLSYALGRRLSVGDRCVPRYMAELGPDATITALIAQVVQSRSFRMRQPEETRP